MTRVLVDADGRPVMDEAVCLCGRFGVEHLILCDTSYHFGKVGAHTPVVSREADNVDFALVNLLRSGDVAVTQDYGLAAMCMARGVRILNQDGIEHTAQNTNALLLARHIVKKIRNAGDRLRGPCKRLSEQDQAFCGKSARLLREE